MEHLKLCTVIECFPVNFGQTLRDPMGEVERYKRWNDWSIRQLEGDAQRRFNEALAASNSPRVSDQACNAVNSVLDRIHLLYACGEPLPSMVHRLEVDLPFVAEMRALNAAVFGKGEAPQTKIAGRGEPAILWERNYKWTQLFSLGLICLLAPDAVNLASWLSLFRMNAEQQKQYPDERSYYIDALLRAFQPDWPVDKNKHTLPTRDRGGERREAMESLFRALAQPTTEARSAGLAQHMSRWNRLMKPYGWKPRRVYPPLAPDGAEPPDHLWVEFAFDAALAVCGWDLDDSAFRDHPYYPRDLVDHYRTQLRHARDAWRPHGAGAGIEIESPPPLRKLDLVKSKSRGVQRWVELASDGNADATVAVIDEVGKPRTIKDVSGLACALAENGAAVHADIKDDETVSAQIDVLLAGRELPDLVADGAPHAGPDRCAALLRILNLHLADSAYRLFALADEGDAWSAVLVPRAHEEEFEILSAALKIPLGDPSTVFKE